MSLAGLPDFKTEQASTVGLPKIHPEKVERRGRLDSETAKINTSLPKQAEAQTESNYLCRLAFRVGKRVRC